MQSFTAYSEFPKQCLLDRRYVEPSGRDPKGPYRVMVLTRPRHRMVQEDPIGRYDTVWESRKTSVSLSAQPLTPL